MLSLLSDAVAACILFRNGYPGRTASEDGVLVPPGKRWLTSMGGVSFGEQGWNRNLRDIFCLCANGVKKARLRQRSWTGRFYGLFLKLI